MSNTQKSSLSSILNNISEERHFLLSEARADRSSSSPRNSGKAGVKFPAENKLAELFSRYSVQQSKKYLLATGCFLLVSAGLYLAFENTPQAENLAKSSAEVITTTPDYTVTKSQGIQSEAKTPAIIEISGLKSRKEKVSTHTDSAVNTSVRPLTIVQKKSTAIAIRSGENKSAPSHVIAKPLKGKQYKSASKPVIAEEKIQFSYTQFSELINKLEEENTSRGRNLKGVQVRKTVSSNVENAYDLAPMLQKKGFIVCGRRPAFSKTKGVDITSNEFYHIVTFGVVKAKK